MSLSVYINSFSLQCKGAFFSRLEPSFRARKKKNLSFPRASQFFPPSLFSHRQLGEVGGFPPRFLQDQVILLQRAVSFEELLLVYTKWGLIL